MGDFLFAAWELIGLVKAILGILALFAVSIAFLVLGHTPGRIIGAVLLGLAVFLARRLSKDLGHPDASV
jgi:hypothetical protein